MSSEAKEAIERLLLALSEQGEQIEVIARRAAGRKPRQTSVREKAEVVDQDAIILAFLAAEELPKTRLEISEGTGLRKASRAWSRLLSRLERGGHITSSGTTNDRVYAVYLPNFREIAQ